MTFHFHCSDIFSLGFGPFRWVCTSADPADLAVTDNLTLQVLDSIITKGGGCAPAELMVLFGSSLVQDELGKCYTVEPLYCGQQPKVS